MIESEKKVLKSKIWQPGDVLIKIHKDANNIFELLKIYEMWIVLENKQVASPLQLKALYICKYKNSTNSNIYENCYNCLGPKEYFLIDHNIYEYFILEA